MCAVLIILIVSLPNFFALFPLVGTFHFCRNVFCLASRWTFTGARSFIRVSVNLAHIGLVGFALRYSFSHTSLMVSFLFLRLSSSIPPDSHFMCRESRASLGVTFFPHMKDLIRPIRVSLTWLGIPWAFVRNWVQPPTMICARSLFPLRDG